MCMSLKNRKVRIGLKQIQDECLSMEMRDIKEELLINCNMPFLNLGGRYRDAYGGMSYTAFACNINFQFF